MITSLPQGAASSIGSARGGFVRMYTITPVVKLQAQLGDFGESFASLR
jgi:hypothetical protein